MSFGTFRFILALNVLATHVLDYSEAGPQWAAGYGSVEAFFVLSGYFITHSLRRSYLDGLGGFSRFWINRSLRLYPTHWLALLVCLSLPSGSVVPAQISDAGVFPNIMLWGMANVFSTPNPPVNGPMWSLGIELPAYLVMSIWAARSHRHAKSFIFASLIILLIFSTIYQQNASHRIHILFTSIATQMFPFSIGCWLVGARRSRAIGSRIFIISTLFTIWVLPFDSLTLYLFALVTPLAILACEAHPGGRLDQLLGNLSYPVYVWHIPVIAVLSSWKIHGWLLLAGTPLMTILVAMITIILVDSPIALYREKIRNPPNSMQIFQESRSP